MNPTVHMRVAGYFRLQIANALGEVHTDTGWFSNLIVDQGLDWIGGGAPNFNTAGGVPLCTHCGVGTGTTTPAFSDTGLTTPLAMFPTLANSNVEGFGTTSFVVGPPAYWSAIKTYGFALGAVVGNISEVCVGNTANGNTTPQAFSHALIVDSMGNPTTISVTSGDALTVTYELRYFLNTTDTAWSASISSTTYSGIYRRANIGSVGQLYYQIDARPGTSLGCTVYTGVIGAITSSPSSQVGSAASVTSGTYVPGTHFQSFTANFGTADGNSVPGLSAMLFLCNHGQWQFSISPVIPKTNLFTMTLQFNVSWSRFP